VAVPTSEFSGKPGERITLSWGSRAVIPLERE
jgi:hypothetical protein